MVGCPRINRRIAAVAVLWPLLVAIDAAAVGESSTRFNTYLPASNYDGAERLVGFYVTASGEGDGATHVSVWDMPADNCPQSECDPFGLLQSGTDGEVSGTTLSAASGNFADPGSTDPELYPWDRYVVLRNLGDPALDRAFRITSFDSATSVTLADPDDDLVDGSSLAWVYAKPGDVDDSFPGVVLHRGETFGLMVNDSNGCITSLDAGECTHFNADNVRSQMSKEDLVAFFQQLDPTPEQLSALRASLVTYPVPARVDDMDAAKDGDYLIVQASAPVTTYSATQSRWQHDTAVSDTKNALGQSFYIFAAPTQVPDQGDRDIEIFAYQDDTWITISRIGVEDETQNNAACATCICRSDADCTSNIAEVDWSNITRLTFPYQGGPGGCAPTYDHMELDAGQSFNLWNRTIQAYEATLGCDTSMRDQGIGLLKEGQTYYVSATKPVTIMFGELQYWGRSGSNYARDGGGMVPSANGTSSGELFYFSIPAGKGDGTVAERELRVISFENDNTVCLDAWNIDNGAWPTLSWVGVPYDDPSVGPNCLTLQANERIDLTGTGKPDGQPHPFKDLHLFRLTSSPGKRISVAEANWMETGAPGTSDMASFVSPRNVEGEGGTEVRFLVYMAPPGAETTVHGVEGTYAHIFVFAEQGDTLVTFRPTDVNGEVHDDCKDEFPEFNNRIRQASIERDGYFDFRMDVDCYVALDQPPTLRPYVEVLADANISVLMSNYNDNWMNYSTSLLPATPNLTMEIAPALLSIPTDNADEPLRQDSAWVIVRARHLFPVQRDDPLRNARLEVILPDGLALDGDPVVEGESPAWSADDSGDDGRTFVEFTDFEHQPFTTLVFKLPVVLQGTFKDGTAISQGQEDQLVVLAMEEGLVSDIPMAGYASSAVRVFRCEQGDAIYDPDNDGQCSGTGVCHDVDGTTICAGADLCPHHHGNEYDVSPRCPTGYVCEAWGVCFADSVPPTCATEELAGNCALLAHELDTGLTCTPEGCVTIAAGQGCAEGDDLCTQQQACVDATCVPIVVDADRGLDNPGCGWDSDSFGYCPNTFACVDGDCMDRTADGCEGGGNLCAHGWECTASMVCAQIPGQQQCSPAVAGRCPHVLACVAGACIDIGGGEGCGGGGALCPSSQACASDSCAVIGAGDGCEADGSLCPHGLACVESACVDIGGGEACGAGGGLCSHGQACVDNSCVDIGAGTGCDDDGTLCPHLQACLPDGCAVFDGGDSCGSGASLCPHGQACVADSCSDIDDGSGCGSGGDLCPHSQSCVGNSCVVIGIDAACGAAAGSFCPHVQACVDGTCVDIGDQACELGGELCPNGEGCAQQSCSVIVSPCDQGGVQCPHGQACVDQVCQDIGANEGCGDGGALCPQAQACIDQSCTEIGLGSDCGLGGSVCPHGEACVDGSCEAIGAGEACGAGGSLCPHGQACVDNACQEVGDQACGDGGTVCPHGQACVAQSCVSIGDGEDCSPLQPGGYCPHGLLCVDGACTPLDPLNSCDCAHPTGDCPQGEACVCPASATACTAANCQCLSAVTPCSSDQPTGACPPGMECLEGGCHSPCSADAPAGWCPQGEVCVQNRCQQPCGQSAEDGYCLPGTVCQQGVCTGNGPDGGPSGPGDDSGPNGGDAHTPGTGSPGKQGCGCSAEAAAPPWILGAVAFWLMRRKGRQKSGDVK